MAKATRSPGQRDLSEIRKEFDERFVRMWHLYLRSFSAGFREARLEVHQILLSRGKPRDLPLTREDLYTVA